MTRRPRFVPEPDPTLVLTLEIPVSAPEIGQVARYLTQTVRVTLESQQAHLDDLSGQSGQFTATFSRGAESVTLDETTGEIIDSVFGGGR